MLRYRSGSGGSLQPLRTSVPHRGLRLTGLHRLASPPYPSPVMAHTISDRQRRARDVEINRAEILRAETVLRLELAAAADVVAVWNSRLAAGAELFFCP